jgi:HPt (histidine-containing phosphotransfer) domain-containing protein
MSDKTSCPSCGAPSADHYLKGHCHYCGLLALVKETPAIEDLVEALEASFGAEAEEGD